MGKKELDPELVEVARRDDIEEYKKHGVHETVPIADCIKHTGKNPIGLDW